MLTDKAIGHDTEDKLLSQIAGRYVGEELIERLAKLSHLAWVESMGLHKKEWKDVGKTTKEHHRRRVREILEKLLNYNGADWEVQSTL